MTLVEKLINEHNQAVQYTEESLEKDGFLSGMKKAIDIVKKHNGWISVDDKLPSIHDTVLVYGNFRYIITAELTDEGKWDYSELMPYDSKVTHWQPLPEPPKE